MLAAITGRDLASLRHDLCDHLPADAPACHALELKIRALTALRDHVEADLAALLRDADEITEVRVRIEDPDDEVAAEARQWLDHVEQVDLERDDHLQRIHEIHHTIFACDRADDFERLFADPGTRGARRPPRRLSVGPDAARLRPRSARRPRDVATDRRLRGTAVMKTVRLTALTLVLATACRGPVETPDLHEALAPRLDAVPERTDISVSVVSAKTGEAYMERHADRLLLPASNMKLVTVAAAVHHGVVDDVLRTTLVGRPDGRGPLWLVGDGDPLLDVDDLDALIDGLRARGVSSVEGPILATGARLPGPRFGYGWMWDDEPGPSMPHLSGLTMSRGVITVTARGEPSGAHVEVRPDLGHLALDADLRPLPADAERPAITITRTPRHGDTVTVRGAVRVADERVRRLSIPDPARYVGAVLAKRLRAAGLAHHAVDVDTSAELPPTSLVELAAVERRVDAFLPVLLKESDNLAAELLLRHLGRGATDDATEAGIARVEAYLRHVGHDPDDLRVADGSGLSRMNLITTRLVTDLLVDMANHPDADRFRSWLAVAGVDGTLASRMTGTAAEGRAVGKTGTLGGVTALAGYTTGTGGEPLAFAMFVQHYTGSSRPWREWTDGVVVELTEP